MNKHKQTRFIAVLLVLVMLVTGLPITSSAASAKSSTAGFKRTLEEVREIIATVTYAEYKKLYAEVPSGTKEASVKGTSYVKGADTTATVKSETYDGVQALYCGEEGKVTWSITAPSEGMYEIEIDYYPVEGKATSIERALYIDGKIPFSRARSLTMTKVWVDEYPAEWGIFKEDINGNQLRPSKGEAPEWRTYSLCDSTGFEVDNFKFYFTKGEHTLTLEAVREPVAIAEIRLVPVTVKPTYEEYLAAHQSAGTPSIEPIKVQAEIPSATSEQTIYQLNDRSSAISEPQSPSLIRLNSIGSNKWQTCGQWIRYDVEVPQAGLYSIVPRFRQELLTGMYTSRRVRINGEVPFKEASYLQFNYNTAWQTKPLNDGETEFLFYLEQGMNTIEFEVVLGSIGIILTQVSKALDELNADYLRILMITGASPDAYRDYNFGKLIPETIINLADNAELLFDISEELTAITGEKGQHVATLDTIANLIDRMASDEDEVAKNLGNLKSYLGTLGTWLYNTQNQSLRFDYFVIQSPDEKLPKATSNFFQAAGFEISAFVLSFFSDYNTIGSTVEGEAQENVTMWYTAGRDQAQLLRQMIDNDYTPESGIGVTLKLVAGGSLLPSILAGVGPDISFLGSADTINYAIRSAVVPINEYPNFEEVTKRFSPAAMIPLTLYGSTYGLPSTQSFPMMFYRMDVFAELQIELPETWEDMYTILPVLQNNHMEIAFPSRLGGTILTLYQMGGELYADEGKRINLDSNVGLTAFETLTDLFQKYKFPLTYDFATRFRTGELPLGVADYTTYNTLVIYASEIRDIWEMVPMFGWEHEDGTINSCVPATVSAIVLPRTPESPEQEQRRLNAWDVMCWFTSAPAQARYANELVAVLGPAGKYNTANIEALAELPWTANEYKALEAQMMKLAAVPEYPGGYIIDRYVNFAFMNVYNNAADAVESMLDNITDINKEISRKRKEFGLEFYEISYSTSFVESKS